MCSKMVNTLLSLTFALAIPRSASVILTVTPSCIADKSHVELMCKTNNFNNAILFFLGVKNNGGCDGGVCSSVETGYTPTQVGSEYTYMTIIAYNDSRDGGVWTCNDGGTSSNGHSLQLGNCNNLCVGILVAVTALCILYGAAEAVRVTICIIIYCWCTQKVTITATADINTNLKSAKQIIKKGKQQSANLISAKQTLNKGKQQPISIIQNKECSIVALGGESHECVFETDAGVLNLKFKIKDDLLNVIPGQTIDLPTLLEVDPKYSTIKWFHNGREFQNDSLYFTTRVTRSTYGEYSIKMKFEDLGLTILIEKMRVQGIYWMLIIISVPINVLCGGIGAAITEYYRSTDGFCISVISIIIPAVLCVIVNGLLVVVLVYNLFKRRTGNEKKSGSPKPANVVPTTTTPSTTSGTSPSAVITTYSASGTSPSAVITAYSTDQDRRNRKPSKLPDGYDAKITLKNISGNDQILKENAEQINLLDRKS